MKMLLGMLSNLTPTMMWVRGILLSMFMLWIWYTISLQGKIDDLNVLQGEQTAAIAICELDKKELFDTVSQLKINIDDYKNSWEDQKAKSKDAEDIIDALNVHTKKLISNLKANKPKFETCKESMNWLLSTALTEETNESN